MIDFLKQHEIDFVMRDGKPYVEGDLNLSSLESLPKGCSFTVGGCLYLRSLTSLPEGCSFTVGRWLKIDNRSIPSTRKGEEMTTILSEALAWENGRYRCIDGIFCEVLHQRKNVMKVLIKGKKKYIIKAGDVYSRGDSIKDARDSLKYKISKGGRK